MNNATFAIKFLSVEAQLPPQKKKKTIARCFEEQQTKSKIVWVETGEKYFRQILTLKIGGNICITNRMIFRVNWH